MEVMARTIVPQANAARKRAAVSQSSDIHKGLDHVLHLKQSEQATRTASPHLPVEGGGEDLAQHPSLPSPERNPTMVGSSNSLFVGGTKRNFRRNNQALNLELMRDRMTKKGRSLGAFQLL